MPAGKPNIRSVAQLLQWGNDELQSHGIPGSMLDAGVLLAHTLHINRQLLLIEPNLPVDINQIKKYKDLIERRCQFEPVAYLTREKEFMSLTFHVSPDVLIPRPETELLVEEVVLRARDLRKSMVMVDIGTGTGCIAVACARIVEDLQVYATDVNQFALQIAKTNAVRHKVENRIYFYKGDLFSALPENMKEKRFDFVVSNPPYIEHDEISKLQKDIRDYEPIKALDGGEDGLHFIREIIEQAPAYLKENGFLLLEIGYNQGAKVKELLDKNNKYKSESVVIKKDYAGLDRVAIAIKN